MTADTIIKRRSVLVLTELDSELAIYWNESEDDEANTTVISIARDVYDGMGSPETITVTVEPGDLLNVEDQS